MVKGNIDMAIVKVEIGYIDVDVDLNRFDTDSLVEEIESRGFEVLECNDPQLTAVVFETHEKHILIGLIEDRSPDIGSELYFLREKLVRA